MKKSKLVLSAAVALAASCAFAGPGPITLPAVPLFLQFTDAEQISATQQLPGQTGLIVNRGIVQVTSIVAGTALVPRGSDIQGGGANIFVNGFGPQVLGLFQINQFVAGGPTPFSFASGGFVDLYWFDASAQNVGTELADPLGPGHFDPGNSRTYLGGGRDFTCTSPELNSAGCTFLVRLDFVSGIEPGRPGVAVSSPASPATQNGVSQSYLSVDLAVTGAWSNQLNTNFFALDPCNNPAGTIYVNLVTPCPALGGIPVSGVPGGMSYPNAADVRLNNTFDGNGAGAWNALAADGSPIRGLRSNDPGRAFVPEPGSLALLGLALAGLAAMKRRWRGNA